MKNTAIAISLVAAICLPLSTLAASYKAIEVKDGGSISGKVTFKGKDPEPKNFLMTKDPETCGTGYRDIDFVKVNNGALGDSVVYIHKIKSGKAWSNKLDNPVLDQKKCTFNPFLGVMRNGDTLTVNNLDATLHNIHTYEIIGKAKKTVFNVSQPEDVKQIKKKVNLKRGTAMKLECDAHDFMHGFSFVAKSPYYAVVKADGSFKIDNVPPGKYTIKAWHGTLGVKKGKVTVTANSSAAIDFEFKDK